MLLFLVLLACLKTLQNGECQEIITPVNPSDAILKKLTEFRHQHRKTIDGRLCAAAFVEGGVTFTDCTDTVAPDGTLGKDWCYVEAQEFGKGPMDWSFCAAVIHYDKIRTKALEAFEIKISETEKMVEILDLETKRVDDMINRYKSTCGLLHESTEERLSKMETLICTGKKNINNIDKSISNISLLKTSINKVEEEVEESFKNMVQDPKFCGSLPEYQDFDEPSGLKGTYYDNPFFQNAPRAFRNIRNINFTFRGNPPVEGLNHFKYSIVWNGYLLAPHTGSFVFTTETDCGIMVFLNDRSIIIDRIPDSVKDPNEDNNSAVINKNNHGLQSINSNPQKLIGGKKFSIMVKVIHSSHLKYENPHSAIIKLLWKSGNIPQEVIPPKYFFTSNSNNNVKISGLQPNNFEISNAYEGEFAFIKDESHVINDLPKRYEGLKMIRTLEKPDFDHFSFKIDQPSIIYVASLVGEPIPIELCSDSLSKIRKTNNVFSIYKSDMPGGKSISSSVFDVRYFEAIGLINFEIINKDHGFIIFVEKKIDENVSCGGEEEVLSITDGPYFDECSVSSEASEEYGCRAALIGKHMDKRNSIWRTGTPNGVGEFLEVKFKKDVQITKFRFNPRDDAIYAPSEITLTFSKDGDESQIFNILNSNNLLHYTYDLHSPIITNYVKAEITQMYMNSVESGGSFEFIGTPCKFSDDVNHKEPVHVNVSIDNCNSSIESIPEVHPIEEGQKFNVECPEKCIVSPEGTVYGTDIYSYSSTICTSAIHAGLCKNKGSCKVLLVIDGIQENFVGSTSNGIVSQNFGSTPISFSLYKSPASDESEIEKHNYAISFQSPDSSIPIGFMVDNGQVKFNHDDIFYGWLRPAKFDDCPLPSSNLYNNNGIQFASSNNNEECTNEEICSNNFWSITLPENGRYRIEAQVGSHCNPAFGEFSNYLQVNGHSLIDNVLLSRGEFYWAVDEVDVEDHKIVVTSDCPISHTCKNSITTINNIKINKVN